MNWILLDWGGADSMGTLNTCFQYCMRAIDTPIHMWGYTFTIAKCIYGCTALSITAKFIRKTTKILNRGSVD